MGDLAVKELKYNMIPELLEEDFKESVFEAYFDYGYTETKVLWDINKHFSVMAESYEITGFPFAFFDDDELNTDDLAEIELEREDELIQDILVLLNHFHIFVLEREYTFWEFHNMPIKEVW